MTESTPLGELEHLLLLVIVRLRSEAYGLSIARELEARAGRPLSRGALYTSLERLELKGLIRWHLETGGPERQGLPKRVYAVTPRGLSAVRAAHRVLRRMWRGLDDVLKEPAP
jgi:PadR family transcriptional regulator, regulatory protein PadR